MDDDQLKLASEVVKILLKVLWPVMIFMVILDAGGLGGAVWIHSIDSSLSLPHVFWAWFPFVMLQSLAATSIFFLEGYARYKQNQKKPRNRPAKNQV